MQDEKINIVNDEEEIIVIQEDASTSGGIDNYELLNNLPSINNIKLIKNKTAKDLKLQDEMKSLTNMEIKDLIGGN